MRKIFVIFIILSIYKLALICPSYGMETMNFREKDYVSCIKDEHPLNGYSLRESYILCYEHFSNKYNQIANKKELTFDYELKKCTYAIALSEILLKPLQPKAYGDNGVNIQNTIGYLSTYLNVCTNYLDQPLSDDYYLRFRNQQRYATLYATMLSIKFEKWFPGNVNLEEFTNLYMRLAIVQSTNHTGTIQLYMAHLIVFNNVRPNRISDQEAIELASQLAYSTFRQKNENNAPVEKLCQALTKKQKDQSVPVSKAIYKNPSLTTKEEREHRFTIMQQIDELKKEFQQITVVEENVPQLVQQPILKTKKRKMVIYSDDDESGEMQIAQPSITFEPITAAGINAQQTQLSGSLFKKGKMVIEDEESGEMQIAQPSIIFEPITAAGINAQQTQLSGSLFKKGKMVIEDEESEEMLVIQPSILCQPQLNINNTLEVGSLTKDHEELKSRKKKQRLVEDDYDHKNVKEYVLSQWKKGHNPDIDEIAKALQYEDQTTRRAVSSYKYNLTQQYPDLVPALPHELTPTQKIIKFLLKSKNAWLDLSTLFIDFNQLYPDLLTEKYFRDHAGLVRSILVRKSVIPNYSKHFNRDNFVNTATYVENNPLGGFDKLHVNFPKVNKKYFYEIRSIYRDYAELYDIEVD
jgi:hypothetical protein